MKIAMVIDGFSFGGIERIAIQYISLLRERGHTIDIFNLVPDSNEMEHLLPSDQEIIYFRLRRNFCPHQWGSTLTKSKLSKFLLPIGYVAGSIYMLYKKAVFSFKLGRKHKEQYDIAIGISGHYNDLGFIANKFIKFDKSVGWLHGGIAEYLMLNHLFVPLYQKVKNVVVLSTMFQEVSLWTKPELESVKIFKLHNPVDMRNAVVDNSIVYDLKEKHGKFFLMVGRFSGEKNQIDVIKALKILHEQYKIKAKLILVGDGKKKPCVESYVKDNSLENWVIFTGNKSDVQNYYAACHIFAHASIVEGLPTVFLEAMHYGNPIVANNALPGVSEALLDGKYGLVSPIGDIDNFAKNMASLYTDKLLYEKYSQLSLERSKRFLPELIGDELEQVFKKLV